MNWFRRLIFRLFKYKRCPYCFRKLRLETEFGDFGSTIAQYLVCPKDECKYHNGW